MREYKLFYLNKDIHLSRQKDLTQAETVLNEKVREGWILQQIVSPADIAGALVAVMYKEI